MLLATPWLTNSRCKPKQACGILAVYLAQNALRQPDSVNSPSPLRGNRRRRVVEILILGFQKAVINLIQGIDKNLLRRIRSVRHRVCSKKNPILISVKKLSRHPRLSAEFTDPGS